MQIAAKTKSCKLDLHLVRGGRRELYPMIVVRDLELRVIMVAISILAQLAALTVLEHAPVSWTAPSIGSIMDHPIFKCSGICVLFLPAGPAKLRLTR